VQLPQVLDVGRELADECHRDLVFALGQGAQLERRQARLEIAVKAEIRRVGALRFAGEARHLLDEANDAGVDLAGPFVDGFVVGAHQPYRTTSDPRRDERDQERRLQSRDQRRSTARPSPAHDGSSQAATAIDRLDGGRHGSSHIIFPRNPAPAG